MSATCRWLSPFQVSNPIVEFLVTFLQVHMLCKNSVIIVTGGQSNLTEGPHSRCTWTVQSYSSGGANVQPHLTHASLGPRKSIPQTTARLVQLFLLSTWQRVPILYNGPPLCSFTIALVYGLSGTYTLQWAAPLLLHNCPCVWVIWTVV